jgi:hypothetical protein
VSGGKKPRIGRPPIPKKLHKASLLSVRFSAEERRLIDRAAKDEGLSAWARRVLLSAASSGPAPLPEPAPESPSALP